MRANWQARKRIGGAIATLSAMLLLADLAHAQGRNLDWLRTQPLPARVPEMPSAIVPKVRAGVEAPEVERPIAPKIQPKGAPKIVPKGIVPYSAVQPRLLPRISPVGEIFVGAAADTRQQLEPGYFQYLPFSAVTRIYVKYPGVDRAYQGSGFLLESGLVLTAGHVLHNAQFGRAEQVAVTPGCFQGRSGDLWDPGFAQVMSSDRVRVHERWGQPDYAAAFDYGVVLLPDVQLFKECGHFRLMAFSDSFLINQARGSVDRFIVTGFPLDKDQGQRQWFGRGQLMSAGRGFIRHLIDTEKGQSGSPLLDIGVEAGTNRKIPVAFGVHSRGARDGMYNIAARVDADLLRRVAAWSEELTQLNAAGR